MPLCLQKAGNRQETNKIMTAVNTKRCTDFEILTVHLSHIQGSKSLSFTQLAFGWLIEDTPLLERLNYPNMYNVIVRLFRFIKCSYGSFCLGARCLTLSCQAMIGYETQLSKNKSVSKTQRIDMLFHLWETMSWLKDKTLLGW